MKSLIASILILGLVGIVVGAAALAQEASVAATVTPQIISVSVADGTVDYGILDIGETNDTVDGTALETQTITSGSNVSTNVALRSSDAAATGAPGVTSWALAGTAGPDEFVHSYDVDSAGAGSAVWTAFPSDATFDNIYTATVVTLTEAGGADDNATLDLKIDMPTSITDTSAHSITVTVLVTEI